METKENIVRELMGVWILAAFDKKKRGEIVRHVVFVTGMHPKSVPRAFLRMQMRDSDRPEKRGRKIEYGADVTSALKDVWDAASRPCAENLHGQIADYVAVLKRDGMWRHGPAPTEKLLAMSLGLLKLRIGKFVRIRKMVRGKSTTKPGTIKSLIPIRSGPWNDAPAGTVQVDTVAHCGDSIAGDFIYTVNTADVATLWGARRAQWNKGREQTTRSMEQMDADFPYPIIEWHPDSGSEFINWFCKGWTEARNQKLTRSRPNRKNDNCFVEERNGHVVRKWVGYARLGEIEVVDALNELYDVLTPYLNHFAASRRSISKKRIGSKWRMSREKKSLTPYQRVMVRHDVSETAKEKLRTEHGTLNPLTMKREIDRRLRKVFDVHDQHRKPEL